MLKKILFVNASVVKSLNIPSVLAFDTLKKTNKSTTFCPKIFDFNKYPFVKKRNKKDYTN